jgi:nicotinamide-nucleotide amidase
MEMLGVAGGNACPFGAVSEETARADGAWRAVPLEGDPLPLRSPALPVRAADRRKSRSGWSTWRRKVTQRDLIHSRMLYGDIGRAQVRLATVSTALA